MDRPTKPLQTRLRRWLLPSVPGTSHTALDERLLVENLEPRILYSAAPVVVPLGSAAVQGAETIHEAAALPLTSYSVAPLPIAELAALRSGNVTITQATGSDSERAAAVTHESAHAADSAMEHSPLPALFADREASPRS